MVSHKRVVFTGTTGLLGGYFLKSTLLGYETFGTGNRNVKKESKKIIKLNLTDGKKILEFIRKIKPQVIIHAASIGNVDYCEKNPDEAYQINVEGTKNMIVAAKAVRSKIIFLSSNAVYNGIHPPYSEESICRPVDVYGKTKVLGEKLIKNSGLDFAIVRLITMYGWPSRGGRANPVTWMIDNLKKKKKIFVVSDIYNNHLWAGQAAKVLWKIIKEDKRGEYNIAGKDSLSRYDLALKVARIFGLDSSLITPVGSDFFTNIAKRPKNTCFDTSKMEKELGIKPLGIDDGLRLMREEMPMVEKI